MNTWAPLWSGIVDSSIWDEPDHVVKVFMTMLALKDSDHVYLGDAYKLSIRSRKTELEVLDALKILTSPDTKRVSHQAFDGRRIRAVEGGWLILNGQKYRDQVQVEMRRANNRKSQAAYRARKQAKSSGPLIGEAAYERNVEQFGVEEADRMEDVKAAINRGE